MPSFCFNVELDPRTYFAMKEGQYFVLLFLDQLHNLNSYVRDFYFFRRNFYPQLTLVHMNPEEASRGLQRQVGCCTFIIGEGVGTSTHS